MSQYDLGNVHAGHVMRTLGVDAALADIRLFVNHTAGRSGRFGVTVRRLSPSYAAGYTDAVLAAVTR